MSGASQDFLLMDTTKGNITIHNRNNSNTWVKCAEHATIWSDTSIPSGADVATGHLGMKTPVGRWCLSTYRTERLYLMYYTDANANSGTNTYRMI
jgi:hypothetical protein